MIKGIGVDSVTISSVERFLQNPTYADDIFTDAEKEMTENHNNPVDFLAGRFAAKQAAKKALSPLVGADVFDYLEVETLVNENNGLELNLLGDLKEAADKAGLITNCVSITTEGDIATAIVIVQD